MDDFIDQQDNTVHEGHSSGFITGHLNSPIVSDEIDFLLEHEKFFCKRHKKLKRIIKEKEYNNSIYNSLCHPYDCIRASISKIIIDIKEMDELEEDMNLFLNLAIDSFNIQCHDLLQDLPVLDLNVTKSKIKIAIDAKRNYLLETYRSKVLSEYIKDEICNKAINFEEIKHFKHFMYDQEILFMYCDIHNIKVLAPITQFLSILDNMQARFPLILYWIVSDAIGKYTLSMTDIGIKLIKIIENLRTKYPRNIYKILNNWEPLIIGYIISKHPDDLGFTGLYNTTIEVLSHLMDSIDIQNLLPPSLSTETCHIYLEMLGMTKIFGHPCLDLLTGFNSVKSHATKDIRLNHVDINNVLYTFRKNFCMEYYKKHRKWPLLDSHHLAPQLRRHYLKNRMSTKINNIDLQCWGTIRFCKNFDYDYSPDTSELIKDSSIALESYLWAENYDHCAFRHLYDKGKPHANSFIPPKRRVIQRFLEGEEYEVEKIVKELDSGYLDASLFIYILCRKERELNLLGRYFVKQVYLLRLAQTSSEKNIAEQIMRYIPEQTMTNTEIQLINKHCSSIMGMSQDQEVIVLDFEKWCLKFRNPLVKPFYEDFDALFGLNKFYSNSHLWYTGGYVFLNSRFAPPDYDSYLNPIPGQYMYENHQGGFEGMGQKKWTIITISLINYIADTLKLKVSILGQGDNQVILIRYTKDQLSRKDLLRTQFLTELYSFSSRLNLVLKDKETWYSRLMFEYGKQRYFHGQAVSQGTKKISRLIPDINDGISSIGTSLSTINTITESAAKGDISPCASFVVNQFEIINFLTRKGYPRKPANQLQALLFFPSIFGGMNLSHLYSHTVRGYDDPLPMWISTLSRLYLLNQPLFHQVIRFVNLASRGNKNTSRLLEDMFALNIPPLPSPEIELRKMVEKYLESDEIKNPEVRRLFDASISIQRDNLQESLTSIRPFYPSLAMELFKLSNRGILQAQRNKFTNVQTINKTVQSLEELNFLEVVSVHNAALIERLKKLAIRPMSKFYIEYIKGQICPTELAHNLRLDHWKLEMVGDTKPYPLHQMSLVDIDNASPSDRNRGIFISLSPEFINSKLKFVTTLGSRHPYIGSTTRQKVKKPNVDLKESTPYIKAIRDLYAYKSWFVRWGNEDLIKTIDCLIQEKLPILPPEIEEMELDEWTAQIYGGNPIHRLQSMAEKNSSSINFLPNPCTHISISTDLMTEFSKGGLDFTIFFQLCFVTIMGKLILMKQLSIPLVGEYLAVFRCEQCTTEVSEIQFGITRPLKSDILPLLLRKSTQCSISTQTYYSMQQLNNWVSYSIGRQLGLDTDVNDMRLYVDNTTDYQENPFSKSISYGVTEFRLSNFHYIILGLVSTSMRLHNMIIKRLKGSDFQLFSLDRTFTSLGQFLKHSGRLHEFLIHINQPILHHSELSDPLKTSEILAQGILTYFISSLKSNILSIITMSYPKDSIDQLYFKFKWALSALMAGECLTVRDSQLLELVNAKTLKCPPLLCKLVYKIVGINVRHYFLPLEEDSALSCWRTELRRNRSFQPDSPPESRISTFCYSDLQYKTGNLKSLYLDLLIHNESLIINIKHIHHIARPLGSISSSCNKILEILAAFKLFTVTTKLTISLAEGSGSILLLLKKIYGGKIGYNTLMTSDVDDRPSLLLRDPPSFLNHPRSYMEDFVYQELLIQGVTDVLHPRFIKKFRQILDETKIDILTIDAESKEERNNTLFVKTYYSEMISQNFIYIIIKLFYFPQIILTLNTIITKHPFILFKPMSSHINNKEIYCLIYNSSRISAESLNLLEEFKSNNESTHVKAAGAETLTRLSTIQTYIKGLIDTGCWIRRFAELSNLDYIYPDFLTPYLRSSSVCSIYCNRLLELVCLDLDVIYSHKFSSISPNLVGVYRVKGRAILEEEMWKLLCLLTLLRFTPGSRNTKVFQCCIENKWIDKENSHHEQEAIISTCDFGKFIFKHVTDTFCDCPIKFNDFLKRVKDFYEL